MERKIGRKRWKHLKNDEGMLQETVNYTCSIFIINTVDFGTWYCISLPLNFIHCVVAIPKKRNYKNDITNE